MHRSRFLLSAAMMVVVALTGVARADIVADHADDVCLPAANPCTITERVEVVDNATLDFGTRALVVSGAGKLDFGDRRGTVLAGPITLGGDGVDVEHDGSGNRATISARRGCSNDASQACLQDSNCGEGDCSVGDGTLTVTAPIVAKTVSPGLVVLNAAGDMTLAASIDVSGSGADSEGGALTARSFLGSVIVNGPIKAESGQFSFGGDIDLQAEVDVDINTALSAAGGDFDGGNMYFSADRDVLIDADLNVASVAGAGAGGYIDISSGRDVVLSGGSGADRITFTSFGHEAENFGGDGGDITVFAGNDVMVGQFVSLISAGSTPDGFGGDVSVSASGDVIVDGELEARSDGLSGFGGGVDVSADGTVVMKPTSNLSADGGTVGNIQLTSGGTMELRGAISLMGRQMGSGGTFGAFSGAELVISGTLTANRDEAQVDLEACRITFETGANFNNNSVGGDNRVTARESMRFLAGSFLLTRATGQNLLIYRDPAKPPVRNGTITPAPVLQLDPELTGCPVCGNSEIDQGETCDDGNTAAADACSPECQLPGCIAGTTGGYPANPLCNDGNGCTVDVCNLTTKSCDHVADCSDGVSCTVDTCQGLECVHTPQASLCSDGNFCNGAEICNAAEGCMEGTPPSCDDAIPCTTDACSVAMGACTHAPNHAFCQDSIYCNGDEFCSATTGCQSAQPAVRNCSDGIACTTDTCDEFDDECTHAPNHGACEDGNECTTNTCMAGTGCVKEPSGLPECPVTTTTTMPEHLCGDATGNGQIQASDSLAALKSAVGSGTCEVAVCDVNGSGTITASDALAILKAAVGQPVELNCGAAAGVEESTTTTLPPTTTTTLSD